MSFVTLKNNKNLFSLILFVLISFYFPFSAFSESPENIHQQIQTLKNEKKYSEAIPLLEKLVSSQPANLDWKIELCNLYRWTKQSLKSSRCLDEVLSKMPDHPDALMGKAYLERSRGHLARGKTIALGVLGKNPQNKDALQFLSEVKKIEAKRIKEKKLQAAKILQSAESSSNLPTASQPAPNNGEAQAGVKGDSLVRDPITSVNRTHFDILDSSKKHWRIDLGGGMMLFNFAEDAPSLFAQLYYTKPKKYFLLGRFDYLKKFNERNYIFTAGGGYYVFPRLILSDTISTALNSDVMARLQNIFEISGIAPHGFNPYVRYNYSQYQLVKLHAITNGLAWYFSNWGILDFNYSNILTKTDVAAGWARDYSTVIRLTFIPVENRFKFYMAYAREQESFDAGNPVSPVGRFRSNHYGGGIEWVMIHNVGIRIDTDYEDRNNGQTVQTYSSSLFYQF